MHRGALGAGEEVERHLVRIVGAAPRAVVLGTPPDHRGAGGGRRADDGPEAAGVVGVLGLRGDVRNECGVRVYVWGGCEAG